jgi:hypothetical protein
MNKIHRFINFWNFDVNNLTLFDTASETSEADTLVASSGGLLLDIWTGPTGSLGCAGFPANPSGY